MSLTQTKRITVFCLLALSLAACNFAPAPQGDASPTVENIESTALPTEPTRTPRPSPTATSEQFSEPVLESPTPTFTPGPPTLPPAPTATLGPYEHTVQADDTLLFIIQQYGYRDFGVIPEVVVLNNLPNADTLPGVGSVLLIPRQTATVTPEGAELTPTTFADALAAQAVAPTDAQTGLSSGAGVLEHVVQEGQTIVDIASNYATTLEVLARLNPDIGFFGCNFEIPSGGPNCNPLLQVGQVVYAPAPTPTPTLSPTPSGSETPTPTPTFVPPRVVSPPQNAEIQAGVFRLEWVGAGVLQPDEVYLVQITDTTSGQSHNAITRSTSLLIPEEMIPADGQTHVINWTVSVAKPNEANVYRIISGAPEVRAFRWHSR